MPALVLSLFGLAMGLLFGWAATEDLRGRGGALQSEASWVALSYCGLVYGPCVAYLLFYHGDWSASYALPTRDLPRGVLTLAAACVSATPMLGFVTAVPFARQRRSRPLMLAGGACIASSMLGCLMTLPQLLVDATYVAYHNNFGTRGVAGSTLGYTLLWMAAVVALVSIWTVSALRRLHTVSSADATPLPSQRHNLAARPIPRANSTAKRLRND